jgi:hypothetical protein
MILHNWNTKNSVKTFFFMSKNVREVESVSNYRNFTVSRKNIPFKKRCRAATFFITTYLALVRENGAAPASIPWFIHCIIYS